MFGLLRFFFLGQIYKIVSPDLSKCYIGSTTEGLSRRLSRHKANFHHKNKYGKKKSVLALNCLKSLELRIENLLA